MPSPSPLAETAPCVRLRPALGTFVRIAARGAGAAVAIDAAYAAVERVEQAMSFHRPDSALHALHRAPLGDTVAVDTDLWEVLRLAQALWQRSSGVFDPTLAPQLVEAGMLPAPDALPPVDADACFDALELPQPRQARLRRRLWLDLGGIAKGYAVDAALAALRAHGVQAASVNAGGDLACYGDTETVALRDPRTPMRLCQQLRVDNEAMATSAAYFRAGALRSRHGTPSQRRHGSVSVLAPRCALADGLTKIVWSAPRRAAAMLRDYNARALVLDARAQARWLR